MKINVQLYGHVVNIDASDIADGIDPDATYDEIASTIRDAVHLDMIEQMFPVYEVSDMRELVAEVRKAMSAREDEP